MIRIVQYRDKCIGCNACVEATYTRWVMSRKDGKSILIGGSRKKNLYSVVVGSEEYEENVKAARNCPVRIIQVEKIKHGEKH